VWTPLAVTARWSLRWQTAARSARLTGQGRISGAPRGGNSPASSPGTTPLAGLGLAVTRWARSDLSLATE